jgi:hypothetical protein
MDILGLLLRGALKDTHTKMRQAHLDHKRRCARRILTTKEHLDHENEDAPGASCLYEDAPGAS